MTRTLGSLFLAGIAGLHLLLAPCWAENNFLEKPTSSLTPSPSQSISTSTSPGNSGTDAPCSAPQVEILDISFGSDFLTLNSSRALARNRTSSQSVRRALVVVDVQNDFASPSGSLVVPNYSMVIKNINRILRQCCKKTTSETECAYYERVVFTKEWHPADHWSFLGNGVPKRHSWEPESLWPSHCVRGTPGAGLASGLELCIPYAVVHKGKITNLETYSAFGNAYEPTKLYSWLEMRNITHVDVAGLAADYCVRATAQDAADLGFTTRIIDDATAPIHAAEWEAYVRKEKALHFISTAKLVSEQCGAVSQSTAGHCAPPTETPRV